MELIFASHNPHKLEEVRAALGSAQTVVSLEGLGWEDEIPETASTLQGNALLKARAVYKKWGKNCFADDTGLEIEALGGQPGVYTARFAGSKATGSDNRGKTLNLLKNQSNRRATFRTVIALIKDGEEFLFEGSVLGEITLSEQGQAGFGYDSIFMPQGFSVTYAQMPLHQRAQMSHRALALQKLQLFLTSQSQSQLKEVTNE